MTKGELTELCLRAVMGGDMNPDLIQRYHPDEIALYVGVAFSDVIKEAADNDQSTNKSDLNSLLKAYPDVPVVADGDRWCSVLPATPLEFPDGRGVHEVIMHEKDFTRGTSLTENTALDVRLPMAANTSVAISSDGNLFYVGTESGIWCFNKRTRESSMLTSDTKVLGDKMPTELVHDLSVGYADVLYVSGKGVLWSYNPNNNTGKLYSSGSGAGDPLPVTDFSKISACKNVPLFAVCMNIGGVWLYDERTSTGKIITISGDPLPQDVYIAPSGNKLVIASAKGGVLYDLVADVNNFYDQSYAPASGPSIADDNIPYCWMNENSDRIYFVDGTNGVWEYNYTTDTSFQYENFADDDEVGAINGCQDRNYFSVATPGYYHRLSIDPMTSEFEFGYAVAPDIGDAMPLAVVTIADMEQLCDGTTAILYGQTPDVTDGLYILETPSNVDTQKELVYRENNADKVFRHLEVNCINDIPGFYIEGGKLYYNTKEVPFDLVDIKMFASFNSYGDDDEIPIPVGSESEVIDRVKKFLTERLQRDPVSDKEEDQGPPDNLKA